VLKPRVAALEASSPAHSNRSLGSDFTPDISPISSSTPSEVDPTEQYNLLEPEERVFRDYANACDRVKNFYTEQHGKQTVEYNIKARDHFHTREKLRLGVWEAIEHLNTLVDDSDPDVSRDPLSSRIQPQPQPDILYFLQTSLSQIEHLLQTAESIRRDGKPDVRTPSYSNKPHVIFIRKTVYSGCNSLV
jgi:Myo-inositol oxygenase